MERTHRWPARIPDSEWLLFTVGLMDSPGGYDDATIEAVSLRTGERRRITQGSRARYAPGGSVVVSRSGSLYALPLDPPDPRGGGSPKPVLDGVLGEPTSGASFFDVSDDGTLAYVPGQPGRERSRLVWMDLSGNVTPLPFEVDDYRKIAVSPDGRDLLFFEYGQVESDIWAVPTDGSRPPQVEVGDADSQSGGVVSPDGRWLAYMSDDAGSRQVYVRPWRRSGSRFQVSTDNGYAAVWAPDGRSLFFVSHAAMFRVPLTIRGEALRAGTPERLFDVDVSTDTSFRDVALHPSGTKFLVRVSAGANERREIGITPGWAGDALPVTRACR